MKAILLPLLLMMPQSVTPEVEARARDLGHTLRCVVCQNQSIEESDAELAADMRALVREELSRGQTEAQVTAMMRERYGDYVLLKPPVQRNTLILWFAPLLLVLGAAIWCLRGRRQTGDVPTALSDAEQDALDRLRR